MVSFDLEMALADLPVSFTVEQLDSLADADGFMRYAVSIANGLRSVIYVNVEQDILMPVVTGGGIDACYEKIHYPEQLFAFSEAEGFSLEEVRAISKAIREHNRQLNVSSNQLALCP